MESPTSVAKVIEVSASSITTYRVNMQVTLVMGGKAQLPCSLYQAISPWCLWLANFRAGRPLTMKNGISRSATSRRTVQNASCPAAKVVRQERMAIALTSVKRNIRNVAKSPLTQFRRFMKTHLIRTLGLPISPLRAGVSVHAVFSETFRTSDSR